MDNRADLVGRILQQSIDLGKHRSARVDVRCGVDNLAGLRLLQAELASHAVDAAGLRQLRLRQAKLAILFTKLVANLLLRLDAVGTLNGVEMLQAIEHDEREEHRHRGREYTHLARANGIGRLDESRIIDVVREDDFRRADSATTHRLLCQQGGVALGDASGPAGFRVE